VQKLIREEIGTSKFCIMVDEARDESKKEQMAIGIRFINKEGLIKERFLDLVRVKDTRWSSHYKSIQSLKKMFSATISVLRSIANDRSVSKYSRGDAAGALQIIVKFDFVFILLMMEKTMKITDVLCQTLQKEVN
jgi:hypothetical protein